MFTCLERLKNSSGKIYLYKLQNLDTGEIIDITSDKLKESLKDKKLNIDNLTLTSNNRLIPKGEIRESGVEAINKLHYMILHKDSEKAVLVSPNAEILKLKIAIFNNKLDRGDLVLYDGYTEYPIINRDLINILNKIDEYTLADFFEKTRILTTVNRLTTLHWATSLLFNLKYIIKDDKDKAIKLLNAYKSLCNSLSTITDIANSKLGEYFNKLNYNYNTTLIVRPIIITLGSRLVQSIVAKPNRLGEVLKIVDIKDKTDIEKHIKYLILPLSNFLVDLSFNQN